MSKKSRIVQSKKRKRINLFSTLEQIDGKNWGDPTYPSHLVTTCHRLRKKQLVDFTIEDFRIMIGQNINLEVLIPLAIPKLEENILASGDFYDGDLFAAVLTSDPSFWKENKDYWLKVKELYKRNEEVFVSDKVHKHIVEKWEKFGEIFK